MTSPNVWHLFQLRKDPASVVDQDKTSNERKIRTYVQGNIKGYEVKKPYTLTLPNKVTPTEQYNSRKSKYYKWLEHSKEEYVGSSE